MRSYLPQKDVKMFLDLLSDACNERYNLRELICFLINADIESKKPLEEESVSQSAEMNNDASKGNLAR